MLCLQTAFVALLAYLFLGEGLHAYDLTGAATIVAGLVIAIMLCTKDPSYSLGSPRVRGYFQQRPLSKGGANATSTHSPALGSPGRTIIWSLMLSTSFGSSSSTQTPDFVASIA